MKRKFNHPPPSARELAGPRYWRSLDELATTPAFTEWVVKEFPAGAAELEGVNRRNFLKIMAASFSLAGLGLSGCRQQTRHLLPYSKQPERMVPGVPIYYSSSLPGPLENIPIIVETHDARPTKIEGNPSYQPAGGATNIFAQASVLDLYNPDRAQRSSGPNGAPLSVGQVLDYLTSLGTKYAAAGGAGLYFLANRSTSPTRARVVDKIRQRFPQAVWAEYEAIDQSNPERAATAAASAPVRPVYDFSKAKRVLALDSDFMNSEPGHLGYARAFAQARAVKNSGDADPARMVRLYSVESNFSLTGAAADHRLRCATTQIPAIAAAVANSILALTGGAGSTDQSALLAAVDADPKLLATWVLECAKDLVANRGAALIVPGTHLPESTQQAVMIANQALQAQGSVLSYRQLPTPSAVPATIADLTADIAAKKVQTLFILNGNPAYDAPGDLAFAARLKSVPEVVRYGYYGRQADETSALAGTFIAGLHYLESWGDGLTWEGKHVPVQPMILPLFDGLGELDVLGQLSGDSNPDAYQYVRDTFAALHPGKSFDEWLAVGVGEDGFAEAPQTIASSTLTAASTAAVPTVSETALEVRFVPGMTWDGRYANNGWMQECPDAMTKLTWDNAIYVSPRLAKQLGLWPATPLMAELGQSAMNDNTFSVAKEKARLADVHVTLPGGETRTIRGPVSILPGLANWTLVIPLGYGRTNAGGVGTGVGFSAYPLVTSGAEGAIAGAGIAVTDEIYDLANVQEHWAMEGRELVREANVSEYHEKPDFVKEIGVEADSPAIYGPAQGQSLQDKTVEMPRGQALYDLHPYNKPAPNYPVWNTPEGLAKFPTPQQWGMSVDLNTCLGCNACIVACQAENNIPVVGKEQVLRGREMQWIRLDRYFATGPGPGGHTPTTDLPEDPQVNFQGMLCQQCELAPCENVCPFMATVHDDQGINTMAYNRCVGTKYCANNCPYKVRRFNFFDWNKREAGHYYEGPLGPDYYQTAASQLTRMQKNPDVTIRMRGVMEKCTYCIQRIESAKINQRIKARDSGDTKVPDGTIKTACQQVCPTNAIQFGDISDANTEVSQAKASDRNYAVLGYLDTRPRTTYLAKLRNPNPAMPDYKNMPLGRLEYETRYGKSPEVKV